MRLLRNIILMALPLMLMINLYRWVFADASQVEYTFKGFSWLHRNIQSFPGLDITFKMFDLIQTYSSELSNMKIVNALDVLGAIGKVFDIIRIGFLVPIMIIVDIVRDIWWFISTMFIN